MKMNINMKKIVFFLLVQFVAIGAFAQEAAIKEAEVAYTKEDYGKAIELYEGLLGVGHLCQYLCREPEGRAGKPEECDRVCSDSDSEKFSRCKWYRLVYSA